MILLSFECPGDMILKYDRYNDYWFAIPELLKDELYVNHIKNSPKYIVLDNGMFESGYPEIDELLNMGREIGADELVLPDYLYKTKETHNATTSFLDSLSDDEFNEFRWMLVVQASTIPTWIQAYKDFTKDFEGRFYSIGIPKSPDNPIYFRTVVTQTLRDRGHLLDIPHHLLGLNHPSELLYMGFVRSCDTSWPFKIDTHKKRLRRINLLREIAR